MRSHVGCGTLTGDYLTRYIQNDAHEKRRKVWQKNKRFEIKNETEDQSQSIPKSIVLRRMFVLNLESLALIGGDLSHGKTHKLKMGYIFIFKFNLTLKVTVDCSTNQYGT